MNINPRQMQSMMKKLGIQQVDIPANEVIIKQDDKEIVILNPNVVKVNMMGQETFQITGEIHERELSKAPEITEEDIETVANQANVSKEDALEALKQTDGDIAEAILKSKK